VGGLAHWRGGASPYVRTVTTAFRAVQIAHSSSWWGSRNIEHIGSAHDDAELAALKEVARQRLNAGQLSLDLPGLSGTDVAGEGPPAPAGAGGVAPITSNRMGVLLEALEAAWKAVGLDGLDGVDEVFRQLAIILGLFFAGLINTAVVSITGGAAKPAFGGLMTWQVLFACLIIPALLFVVFTAKIPESPRYLVSVGRTKEAEEILAKLSGEEDPADRVKAIAQSLTITGGAKLSIGQILSSQWRGLVFVGMAIAAFQQLTGINGVFFYSNSLFAAVGFTESMALAQTLLITAFKIVGVLSGIMLVDRVGRKRMLIYGGTLIFVSLGIVATVFTVAPTVDGKPDVADSPILAFLAVAALCTFLLGFTSSWGPIFSIVMGEMFPNSIRGGAMSLASGADFLVNFLVVLLFPFLIGWSPAGTYWIYCAFGVLAVIFTAKFLTETSGAELEDMDKVVAQK